MKALLLPPNGLPELVDVTSDADAAARVMAPAVSAVVIDGGALLMTAASPRRAENAAASALAGRTTSGFALVLPAPGEQIPAAVLDVLEGAGVFRFPDIAVVR